MSDFVSAFLPAKVKHLQFAFLPEGFLVFSGQDAYWQKVYKLNMMLSLKSLFNLR